MKIAYSSAEEILSKSSSTTTTLHPHGNHQHSSLNDKKSEDISKGVSSSRRDRAAIGESEKHRRLLSNPVSEIWIQMDVKQHLELLMLQLQG